MSGREEEEEIDQVGAQEDDADEPSEPDYGEASEAGSELQSHFSDSSSEYEEDIDEEFDPEFERRRAKYDRRPPERAVKWVKIDDRVVPNTAENLKEKKFPKRELREEILEYLNSRKSPLKGMFDSSGNSEEGPVPRKPPVREYWSDQGETLPAQPDTPAPGSSFPSYATSFDRIDEEPDATIPDRPATPAPGSSSPSYATSFDWTDEEPNEHSMALFDKATAQFAEERVAAIKKKEEKEKKEEDEKEKEEEEDSRISSEEGGESENNDSSRAEDRALVTTDQQATTPQAPIKTAEQLKDEAMKSLRLSRSRLKIREAKDPTVQAIQDDPEERIRLILDKMHQYRTEREQAQAEREQARDQYEEARYQQDEADQAYRYFKQLFLEERAKVKELTQEKAEQEARPKAADLERELNKEKKELKYLHRVLASKDMELKQARSERDDFEEFANSQEALASAELRRQQRASEYKSVGTQKDYSSRQWTRSGLELIGRQGLDSERDFLTGQRSRSQVADTNAGIRRSLSESDISRVSRQSTLFSPDRTEASSEAGDSQTTIVERRDLDVQDRGLISPRTVRWSESGLQRLVPFMTTWINDNAHYGRSDLTEETVRGVIGRGTLSWRQFVQELGRLGYVFRPDHLAQALSQPESRQANNLPVPNAEILFAALNLETASDDVVITRLAGAWADDLRVIPRISERHDTDVVSLMEVNNRLQTALLLQSEAQAGFGEVQGDDRENPAGDNKARTKDDEVERLKRLLNNAHKKLNELRNEEGLQKDIKDNTKDLEKPSSPSEDREITAAKLTSLQEALDKCQMGRAKDESLMDSMTATRADLEKELRDCHKHGEELRKLLAEATANQAKLSAEVVDLQAQVSVLKDHKSILTEQNAELQVKVQELEAQQEQEEAYKAESLEKAFGAVGRDLAGTPLQAPIPQSRPQAWLAREQRIREKASYRQRLQKLEEHREAEKAANDAEIQRLRDWREWMKLEGDFPYVPKENRWADFKGIDKSEADVPKGLD